MAYININATEGASYEAGYFLADAENCTRVTKQISADDASAVTTDNSGKYVPAGATYKETVTTTDGDNTTSTEQIVGIVFEDVDVSSGDMPGSVVIDGTIYKDRLVTPSDADALENIGFKVIDETSTVERPEDFEVKKTE